MGTNGLMWSSTSIGYEATFNHLLEYWLVIGTELMIGSSLAFLDRLHFSSAPLPQHIFVCFSVLSKLQKLQNPSFCDCFRLEQVANWWPSVSGEFGPDLTYQNLSKLQPMLQNTLFISTILETFAFMNLLLNIGMIPLYPLSILFLNHNVPSSPP